MSISPFIMGTQPTVEQYADMLQRQAYQAQQAVQQVAQAPQPEPAKPITLPTITLDFRLQTRPYVHKELVDGQVVQVVKYALLWLNNDSEILLGITDNPVTEVRTMLTVLPNLWVLPERNEQATNEQATPQVAEQVAEQELKQATERLLEQLAQEV